MSEDLRVALVSKVLRGSTEEATDALLAMLRCVPEREWLEGFLREVITGDGDRQVRSLAVACLGHVAHLHGEIEGESTSLLRDLLDQGGDLGARAAHALDDVDVYVTRPRSHSRTVHDQTF